MTRRRAGPSDGCLQGAGAQHRGMDATTAPHHIPPEMPQYGETYHVFELMQVTVAAPLCRDTRRRPGASIGIAGCAVATPQLGGTRVLYPQDRERCLGRRTPLVPALRTQEGGKRAGHLTRIWSWLWAGPLNGLDRSPILFSVRQL